MVIPKNWFTIFAGILCGAALVFVGIYLYRLPPKHPDATLYGVPSTVGGALFLFVGLIAIAMGIRDAFRKPERLSEEELAERDLEM